MRNLIWISIMFLAVGCATAKKNTATQSSSTTSPSAKTELKAKSDSAKTKATKSSECKKGSDDRTLTIQPQADGCELVYAKFGKSKVIATSKSGSKHCDEVFDKIETHLKSSGFSCN